MTADATSPDVVSAGPVETAAPMNCAKCAAPLVPAAKFCEKCGAAAPGVIPSAGIKGRAALGRLATNTHLRHIKSARWAIGLVALLTLAATIFMHVKFSNEVSAARSNPGMTVNEKIVALQTALFCANYLIVAVFTGLIFWVKRNPFAACLTALIIYLSIMVLNAAIDPLTIAQGILMKVVVVALLVKGVKSGLAYRRLAEKGDVA